jgi:hypothetical protein
VFLRQAGKRSMQYYRRRNLLVRQAIAAANSPGAAMGPAQAQGLHLAAMPAHTGGAAG